MCLAICGEIKSLELPFARVNVNGIETQINIELVSELKIGDHVLIHAGFAIEKINNEYFDYLNKTFKKMLEEDDYYDK
ncbi:HypC/HybG/HupF family hydrogenase formation chaperone [Clostridium bovifaecis]|uniref:HypC/HybG/HupF family hydrogenase formation chaperone n=1 Tax=Clostridium bovifaecis TaxID=2184719 RepID=A0A6I6FFB0_9CLOT|nr:HypC/HybG/HupF family hydrogenase formation chaperone [Clostridium bovifaecis]